ncbi:Fasciclin-domain-containing protein [Pleurostoma richardsiae]|uniref:Fasciclin-domain-containing protein n=1 Tax=Pleurostoma richardsiae TaxID=41990 RepID=A0AA38RNK8_9PEZI|nr:Fasciclin-domain-containing protein [Pleurostoma richardsiae]
MKVSGLPSALLGLVAALAGPAVVRADDTKDLGTILSGNKDLSTYYTLIQKYPNILLQLPNYAGVTIIAPSNDAFEKYNGWSNDNQTLVTNILEYHILQGTIATASVPEGSPLFAASLLKDPAWTNVTGGQRVIINSQPGDTVVFTTGEGARSTLLDQDLAFTGGLVQVVDTLLVPPSRLEPTCRDAYSDLKAFLGALYTAGLVETFAETPNVTIFAPRNAAFQLLAGTLSGLARDDLARVLSYHVIPGRLVGSPDLSNGTRLTTLAKDAAGSSLDVLITQTGNNRYVDSAQLVQPDILVANGVVHMIDNVLNPDAAAARPNPSLGTQAPVFPVSGASSTGSRVAVPFTTALPCTSDCPVTTTASANSTSEATSTTSSRTTTTAGSASSRGAGGMLTPPRCTGLAGAGMVGMGMLAMAAVV